MRKWWTPGSQGLATHFLPSQGTTPCSGCECSLFSSSATWLETSRSSSTCSPLCSTLIFCPVPGDCCYSLGFLLNQALLLVCGLVGWPESGCFFCFVFSCVFLEHKHELWFKPLNFLELSRKIEYNKNIAQINVHVISDWCLLFSSWFGQFLTRMIVV